MKQDFYLPYLIDYTNLNIEYLVILIVSMLVAVLISAEAQAVAATILGDARRDATDRLHFNVFLHLSLTGCLNFFVAGFSWPKEIAIDSSRLKGNPRLMLVLARLAGPVANLLMANIAASLAWLLGRFNFDDQVFSTLAVVNVTMALYSMLPFPPLPGAALLSAVLPGGPAGEGKWWKRFCQAGPFLIPILFLMIRLSGWDGIGSVVNPVVTAILGFLLG